MASDFEVVRRVGEDNRCIALAHEAEQELGILRLATGDHVVSKTPHIAPSDDGRLAHGLHVFRQHLFDDACGRLLDIELHIDFDGAKSGKLEVKAEFTTLKKFGLETAMIPPR